MSRKSEETRALLDALLSANRPLTEREHEFVQSMSDRLEQYGDRMYVSDKQLFWLRDIKGKYCDGVAPGPPPRSVRKSDEELYGETQRARNYPDDDGDLPF